MAFTHLIVRYGELFLKGKNRKFFEQQLEGNLTTQISGISLKKTQGRAILGYFSDHHLLKRIFGIVSYSPAIRVHQNLEEIKESVIDLLKKNKGTFKVETNRADKTFPGKSPEISQEIGKYVEKHTSLKFALDAQLVVTVEINQAGAFIFLEKIPCFGGLPVGVEGKIIVLLENEASILAGLLFMKRGCQILPVAPSIRDISLLQKFSPEKLELQIVGDFNEMQVDFAVSGQTLSNMKEYGDFITFRPLIAYREKEIKEQLERFRLA